MLITHEAVTLNLQDGTEKENDAATAYLNRYPVIKQALIVVEYAREAQRKQRSCLRASDIINFGDILDTLEFEQHELREWAFPFHSMIEYFEAPVSAQEIKIFRSLVPGEPKEQSLKVDHIGAIYQAIFTVNSGILEAYRLLSIQGRQRPFCFPLTVTVMPMGWRGKSQYGNPVPSRDQATRLKLEAHQWHDAFIDGNKAFRKKADSEQWDTEKLKAWIAEHSGFHAFA